MPGAIGALGALDDKPASRSTSSREDQQEFGLPGSGNKGWSSGKGSGSKKPLNTNGVHGSAGRRKSSGAQHHGRGGLDLRLTNASQKSPEIKKNTIIPGVPSKLHKQGLILEKNRSSKPSPSLEEAKKVMMKKKKDRIDSEDDDYDSGPAAPAPRKYNGSKGKAPQLEIASHGKNADEDNQSDWVDGSIKAQTQSKQKVYGSKNKGGKRGAKQGNDSLGAVKGKDPKSFYGKGSSSAKQSQTYLKPLPEEGKRGKRGPVVPKIYDLVSDDEDDEAFLRATAGDVYATCDVNDPKDPVNGLREAIPAERRPETRPTIHFIRCTRVSRVYFGKKGYGPSNEATGMDEERRLGVLAHESGIQVQEEFEGDSNKPSLEAMAAPLEDMGVWIEPEKIAKVFVRAIEKQAARLYYFSLLLKGGEENALRNVYMRSPNFSAADSDLSLDPNAPEGSPSKYVTVVVGGEAAKDDHRNLTASLQRMCTRNKIELVRTKGADDKRHLVTANSDRERRLEWDKLDADNMRRQQSRLKRRRRQSEPVAEIGRLESDRETYLVWPFGDEVTNSITITRGDKRRLGPSQYLNDSLIDFKIRHLDLAEFSDRSGQWYAYSTFFYSRLAKKLSQFDESYKSVERWTKNVDIFSKGLLVVPINEGEHWSVIFVLRPGLLVEQAVGSGVGDSKELEERNPSSPSSSQSQSQTQSQTPPSPTKGKGKGKGKGLSVEEEDAKQSPVLLFMDSLAYHNAKTVCGRVKRYLQYEYLSKKRGGREKDGAAFGLSLEEAKSKFSDVKAFCTAANDMRVVQVPKRDLPTQENGFDCGMYVLKYVEYMLRMWPEPTKANVDKAFKSVIFKKGKTEFTSGCIDTERTRFQGILENLKPSYEEYLAEQQREKTAKIIEKRQRILEKQEKENKSAQEARLSAAPALAPAPAPVPAEQQDGAEDTSKRQRNPYTVALPGGVPAPTPASVGQSMDVDDVTLDGTEPEPEAAEVDSMDVDDTQGTAEQHMSD